MTDPAGVDSDAPILIVTNERDFAADIVIQRILSRGQEVERWNTETLRQVSWHPEQPPSTRRASAVWLRQFLAEPTITETVTEVDDFLVAREQWRTWLTDLSEAPVPWMNPLWAARRAENKLIQLRTTVEVGLSVPATIVTNSRDEAARHQSEVGSCIVKSVAAAYFPFSTSSFMFTRPLDEALDLGSDDWAAQPVIVQKQIQPRIDVRVFVVGSFSAAASALVDDVDWRTNSADAVWDRFDAPDGLIDLCRAYLESFGLVYGAFDFAFDGNTCWFLECNQAGEFAFVDRPLRLGVGDAIAAWLCGDRR